MLRKLRVKFIAIAMISIFVVLAVILAVINIVNYVNVDKNANQILDILVQNEGVFPKSFDNIGISEETPYNTRFFCVTLEKKTGDVLYVDTSSISAIDYDTAIEYAQEVFNSGKTTGYINGFKYNSSVKIIEYPTSKTNYNFACRTYIFLDWSSQLSYFRYFLIVSISVCVAGFVLVFLFVVLFSKAVMRPVAESYEKQRRFITDAGHELKTPITIIDANTEVIEMTQGESEWTDSIKNQVKRLTSLTEQITYLAKMEEGTDKVKFTDFSLSDAVQETVDQYKAYVISSGKTLNTKIENNISYNGDEQSIRQVVSLLLDNALKYSNKQGTIGITLQKSGHITLQVSNTTDFIPAGKHDEFFDRFYRGDNSRNSHTGGQGIGLSIVKAVVQSHGGKVTCSSPDGKSVNFTIVL